MTAKRNKTGWFSRMWAEITAFVGEWTDPNGRKAITNSRNTSFTSLKKKDILGVKGEKFAVKHLKMNGYKIRERNVKFAGGEIDIIAQKGNLLVFVEVKTRETGEFGSPLEAVQKVKRLNVVSMAEYYIFQNRLTEMSVRFDVISIIWPEGEKPVLDHYENAFDATEAFEKESRSYRRRHYNRGIRGNPRKHWKK